MPSWLAALRANPAAPVLALLGLALPLSTALVNICAGLVLLLALAGPRYRRRLSAALRHPVALAALALLLLLAVGVTYSRAPWPVPLDMLNKYRNLLLLVLLIPLFQEPNDRKAGLAGLQTGLAVVLIASYGNTLLGWPPPNPPLLEPGVVFKNHITQGALLALAAYLWALRGLDRRGWQRGVLFAAALLAAYNVVFITLGKTGYLVLAALIVLGAIQLDRWRGLIIGVGVIVGLSVLAYTGSSAVQQRIDRFEQHLERPRPGGISSAALRLDYYRYTPRLVIEHPLTGTGTGSFPFEYKQLADHYHLMPSDNPHDEYLLLGVQLGVPGIILFLVLLVTLWRWSIGLTCRRYRWLGQALVIFMASGCLVDSLLLDATEGQLFAFLAALVCAVQPSSGELPQ